MSGDVALREGVVTPDDYMRLRAAAGMHPRSLDAARLGLPHTWHGIVAESSGQAIGMGRIVGDGGCFFQIVDVCVVPEHQGHGVGGRIMAALVAALRQRAPQGAYVSLIADGDAHRLYARFGFEPTAPASIGMFLRL